MMQKDNSPKFAENKRGYKRPLHLTSLDELILISQGKDTTSATELVASTAKDGKLKHLNVTYQEVGNPTLGNDVKEDTHAPIEIMTKSNKKEPTQRKPRFRDPNTGLFVSKAKLESGEVSQASEKPASKKNRKKKPTKKEGLLFGESALNPNAESAYLKEKAKEIKEASRESEKTIVYTTTDYHIFKTEESNRPVKEKRVANLMEDIAEKNLLEAFPIVVKSDMRVMDGQHRLRAAMELGVPIYYMINDDFDLNDIGKINSSSKGWKLDEFLHHFVKLDYPEYIKVEQYCAEFNVPLYNAIGFLYGRFSQPNADLINTFKDGNFVVKDYAHAVKVAKRRDDFSSYAEGFGLQKNFVNAVAKLSSQDEYNHKMMLDKMSRQPTKLKKATTTDGYLDTMIDIYNYATPRKARLSKEKVMGII
jgi:hypothetical protein